MSSEEDDEKTNQLSGRLPFSEARQDAVLGYLLTNESFFIKCVGRIQPGWFNSAIAQKIWAAKVQFHKEFNRNPSVEEVFESRDIQKESQVTKGQIRLKLNNAPFEMGRWGIDAIQAELTEWLHSRIFMEGIYAAKDSFNRAHFKEAYSVVEKVVRQIRESNFDADVTYDFSNPAAIIEKRMANVSKSLTFGHPLIDKLLLPEGNGNGSLLPGSSTTFVAPVNIGKSAVMMNVIVPNLKRQKYCLFIAHEGSIDELRLKFLQIVLNRSNGWLNENVRNPDPEVQAHIAIGVAFLDRYLTFMPMIRQGLTVEQVCGAIRRKSDELLARYGRTFDLVVDDYPAKLTTDEAAGGKLEKRHKDEIIYMAFNRLAEEYGWHSLNAIQTNREGSKINRGVKSYGGREQRLLGMEDVLEAWGPMADTATVFTVNRDPMAKAYDYLILNNCKSRTSATDWAVVCKSQFKNYISHASTLPACWYQGSAMSTSENYVSWLERFNGEQIPFGESF